MHLLFKYTKENTLIKILYFIFIAALPLVFDSRLIDNGLLPRQVYLTGFLLLFFLLIIKRDSAYLSILATPVPLLFFAFIISAIISSFKAINDAEAIYFISKYFILFIFFCITLIFFHNQQIKLNTIINSITVLLILSLILGIYQMLELNSLFNRFYVNMIGITFCNKNLLAFMLFLTLPFLLLSGQLRPNRYNNLNLILLTLTLLFILYLKTRSVWLAVYLSITLYFLITSFIYRKNLAGLLSQMKSKRRTITAILFAIFISLTFIEYQFNWSIFPNTKPSISNNTRAYDTYFNPHSSFNPISSTNTLKTRTILWDKTFNLFKDNPLLGCGPGNWKVYFPSRKIDFSPTTNQGIKNYVRPHNDFLWILSEQGVIGLAIYSSIFIIICFYLVKLIQQTSNINIKHNYIILLVCIIGYSCIACLSFPLERISIQILLLIIMAYVINQYFSVNNNPTVNTKPLFFSLAILGITCSFIVTLFRYDGQLNVTKVIRYHSIQNWPAVKKYTEKAKNYFYNIDPMATPIDWYAGVANFAEGDLQKAKECFENAYLNHPYHIHTINNLGTCYVKLNDTQKGISYYMKALDISADFYESLLNLAAVYFNYGDIDKAYYWIDQCPINCPDIKYKTFLPIILAEKLRIDFNDVAPNTKGKVLRLSSDKEMLVKIYFDSKINMTNFKSHIMKQLSK